MTIHPTKPTRTSIAAPTVSDLNASFARSCVATRTMTLATATDSITVDVVRAARQAAATEPTLDMAATVANATTAGQISRALCHRGNEVELAINTCDGVLAIGGFPTMTMIGSSV